MKADPDTSLTRLLQLCSPNLPLGSYSYSQGLEWAVEQRWVTTASETEEWLLEIINCSLQHQDLPLLALLYDEFSIEPSETGAAALDRITLFVQATRETRELREEEKNRAHAMTELVLDLNVSVGKHEEAALRRTVLAGFACVGARWGIPKKELLQGYAFSSIESLLYAAVKLVPLGQTAAQKILVGLSDAITFSANAASTSNDGVQSAVQLALERKGENLPAFSNPGIAFASSMHETQYSRLFRS